LTEFIHAEKPEVYEKIFSRECRDFFAKMMERDLFSTKRHHEKMNFSDAKIMRRICVGNFREKKSLFSLLYR